MQNENVFLSDYNITIKPHGPVRQDTKYFKYPDLETKELFTWQKKALKKSIGKNRHGLSFMERFYAAQAPCGAGKTTYTIASAITDIVMSGMTQKQLFIVPMRHIGEGFTRADEFDTMSVKIGQKVWEWHIHDNFCKFPSVKKLKKWLLTPAEKLGKECSGNVIRGLNAVCCYQSLVAVWNSLTESEKKIAIKNLTLRIDEAHHLKHVLDEMEFESEKEKQMYHDDATAIGRICTFIVNCKDVKTSKIHTTSATMYRGDMKFIFSDSIKDVFKYFNYSWAEHFQTLGISQFDLLYKEFESDPINLIVDAIAKEPNEYHLVLFPSKGNRWRTKTGNDTDRLIDALVDKGIKREEILDLVTQSLQIKNKELLLKEPQSYNKDNLPKFKVVVACALGREGTNWPCCSRLHNTVCEKSITQAMQSLGRILRRFLGKTKIVSTMYMKKFIAPKDITKKDLLDDRQTAMLLCMVIKNEFMPIMFPDIPADEQDKKSKKHQTNLQDFLGEKFQSVMLELAKRHDCLENKDDKSVTDMIHELLQDYGIKDNIDNITDAMKVNIIRQSMKNDQFTLPIFEGIDISIMREIGYNRIREYCNPTLHFGASMGNCKKDFEILKQLAKIVFEIKKIKGVGYEMSAEDVYKFVEEKKKEGWNRKKLMAILKNAPRITADRWEVA